jgi:CRISPR-associated protein Cmr6
MPIAAVPSYLSQDFASASPGMRFGMYLRLWNQDFSKPKGGNEALDKAKKLTHNDIKIGASLAQRQRESFDASTAPDAALRLEAVCIAPFTTGLGNEHPLENGFAFLTPYGLPYLPGSGIKGVLRQAARELASGDWGDNAGWSTERRHLLGEGKKQIELSDIDALFGLESADADTQQLRGCLSLWDVIPQVQGDSLMVDIMTPHQSHYYQKQKDAPVLSPHDSGSPNPISFLTVPPGSGFVFHVQCNTHRLRNIAPDLEHQQRWKTLLQTAFAHAYEWLGFGAKTAVGYGAMKEDEFAAKRRKKKEAEQAEQQRQQAEQQARETARQTMSPAEQHIDELLEQRPDKTWNDLTTLFKALDKGSASVEHRTVVAQQVKTLMENSKKWKPITEKKNPAKDNDHQDTLKVLKWLQGG